MRIPYPGLPVLLGCLLVTTPFVAWAAENDATTDGALIEIYSDPALITFVQAVVATNPGVQAARAALDASRALESAAGRPLYNPELEADYENAVDSTWSVGIGQTFDWGGKRKARGLVAASDRLAIEAQYRVVRRAVTVELLSGLASYQTGIERDALAGERVRTMHDFAQLAQRRFAAGDLNQVEADLATLSYADAQIKKATAAANLAEARQAVRNLTINSNPSQWPSIRTQLPPIPAISDPQNLMLALPEVQAAQRRVEAANAVVILREREQRPDPTISLRGGREQNSSLVGVSLSIPLYVRNRFKYETSAAMAERDQLQQMADDLLRRAHARYISASERYGYSHKAWRNWQKTGQISLQRQGVLLQRLWEAGELSTTDYLVQLRQTLDTRESALDLRQTMWRAWFEWLAASGQVDKWLRQESTS